jgi:hypothetical protein
MGVGIFFMANPAERVAEIFSATKVTREISLARTTFRVEMLLVVSKVELVSILKRVLTITTIWGIRIGANMSLGLLEGVANRGMVDG